MEEKKKAVNMELRCWAMLAVPDVIEAEEQGDGAEGVEQGVEGGEEGEMGSARRRRQERGSRRARPGRRRRLRLRRGWRRLTPIGVRRVGGWVPRGWVLSVDMISFSFADSARIGVAELVVGCVVRKWRSRLEQAEGGRVGSASEEEVECRGEDVVGGGFGFGGSTKEGDGGI